MTVDSKIRRESPTWRRSSRWLLPRLADHRLICRVRNGICLVFLKATIGAGRACTAGAGAPYASVSAHKGISFFATLFGQSLNIIIPGVHGLVGFGTEYPGMSTVHRSGLATLDYKLMGRTARLRARTKLLVWQVQGHDWWLSVDTVGRFELVNVGRRQNIPSCVSKGRRWERGVPYHPGV